MIPKLRAALCAAFPSAARAEEDPSGSVSVLDWPAKAAKVKKRDDAVATAVVRVEADGREAAYLQVQRPRDGLLGGS